MPVTLLYPRHGEPVRMGSGDRGTIAGVECVDDGRCVRANVLLGEGEPILAVPVAWDPEAAEWVEAIEPVPLDA